jgi:hypothetical protein
MASLASIRCSGKRLLRRRMPVVCLLRSLIPPEGADGHFTGRASSVPVALKALYFDLIPKQPRHTDAAGRAIR